MDHYRGWIGVTGQDEDGSDIIHYFNYADNAVANATEYYPVMIPVGVKTWEDYNA